MMSKNQCNTLRACSAVSTLNGRSERRVRKCRFSVISASAPTHSVYAAMKASADFNPLVSYLTPNSKGTSKSSSTVTNAWIETNSSRKTLAGKFRRISSTIRRGIRNWVDGYFSRRRFRSASQVGFLTSPTAWRYSFVSRTRSKFGFPEFFAGRSYSCDKFFRRVGTAGNGTFSQELSCSCQMPLGLFSIFTGLHCHSPLSESISDSFRSGNAMPGGPSEPLAWSYHSERSGQEINTDMRVQVDELKAENKKLQTNNKGGRK